MGLTGMWMAKVIMETSVFIGFNILIYITDWDKISEASQKRQQKDKQLIEERTDNGKYNKLT